MIWLQVLADCTRRALWGGWAPYMQMLFRVQMISGWGLFAGWDWLRAGS